jgi:transposase
MNTPAEFELQKIIGQLQEKIAELEGKLAQSDEKIRQLEAELEKYKKPPKNSNNSSIPPSQDPFRKRYPKREKSGKKQGGQLGHPGHHHPFSPEPDEVIDLQLPACPHCGSEDLEMSEGEARQVVDIPEIKPKTREYRQKICCCKNCGKKSRASFPENVKARVQFGENTQGLIGYLKVGNQQSHEKLKSLFRDLLNLKLSRGTVDNTLRRLHKKFQPEIKHITEGLQQEKVVGSDETGNGVIGEGKGYVFVFQSRKYCLFVSRPTRSYTVILEVFGETFPMVWVSDRYNGQLKVPCLHQLCLAHILRDCKYLIQAEKSQWAEGLKAILKEAIDLRRELGESYDPLEIETFRKRLQIQEKLSRHFEKQPSGKFESKLYRGLLGRQKQLLYFLEDAEVPFENNASERAVRPWVLTRKMSGGFKTGQGSEQHATLSSIFETVKLQGKNIWDVLTGKTQLFPNTT